VSHAVLICLPWMSLPPWHHARRDGISHRGPNKTSLEHQEKLAFLPMWTDPWNLCIIWRGVKPGRIGSWLGFARQQDRPLVSDTSWS
jgi:hypothetical protein